MVGQTVSHFRILRELGSGGMGVVYEAEDLMAGRHVALKFLPPDMLKDPHALERFRREARAASALNHPNICTLLEVGTADEQLFLVMERMEGLTLKQQMAWHRLPIRDAVDYCIQIADALETAHEKGIIHRDIKPNNIFITHRGLAKLLDFGLVKLHGRRANARRDEEGSTVSTETIVGVTLGTIAYMSPEQALGSDVDARTDLFSLGTVLYEIVTGVLPFTGDGPIAQFDSLLHDVPAAPTRLNPRVPAELERIIGKAMEKDPELRYQTAVDLRTDLERFRRGMDSRAVAARASVDDRSRFLVPSMTQARMALRRFVSTPWGAVLSIALVLAVIALWNLVRPQKIRGLTDRDSIVLGDFDNRTGDPVLDDTLKQALTVKLNESPFLSVLSPDQVKATLRLMERTPEQRLTGDVMRDLCQRAGSKAALSGSIANLGTQYVIGLTATDCATGQSLAAEQVRSPSKEKVLSAIDTAAASLRRKLGEPLATLKRYDTPLEEATTSSLEALRAYSEGERIWEEKGDLAAIPFFTRAVELDPNFARSYGALGAKYENLGMEAAARRNLTRAFELRDRVSGPEKLYIEARYHGAVTGDWERAMQVREQWAHEYPRDPIAAHTLAITYLTSGRFEDGLAQAKRLVKFDQSSWSLISLAAANLALNRLDDARAALDHIKPEFSYRLLLMYLVCFLRNDAEGMQRQLTDAAGTPIEPDLLSAQSDTEAYFGRLRRADELNRRSMDVAMQAAKEDIGDKVALANIQRAFQHVELGHPSQARRSVDAAFAALDSRNTRTLAALVLARAGQTARAEAMAKELARAHPLDSFLNSYWLPTIRAASRLSRGDAEKAVQELRTVRYEMSQPATLSWPMYPVYVRGQAYLATGQGREALREFQKFLDHPGAALNCPLGALARLGLARAYTLVGDHSQARIAYESFLNLWQEADPDQPVLRQAKAEYKKLAASRF
jgi:eukaryotic-like serine/threonine-protein kinase